MDSCIGSIPANPDISGIGVRLAIYIQNFLSFLPAIWALWDHEVTTKELKTIQKQATTILITAFAILISAIVQAKFFGLTGFHTSIVLSLSWMNNTNTFVYFLLYIYHMSDPRRGARQIPPEWAPWLSHVADVVYSRQRSPVHGYASKTSLQGTALIHTARPRINRAHSFTRLCV